MFAIGDGGQSRGECQISIDTALWLIGFAPGGSEPYAIQHGFVQPWVATVAKQDPNAFILFLHYDLVNQGLADAYLDWIRRYKCAPDVECLAYFWNAGHNSDRSKSESWAFAAEVRIMYLGPPRASVKPITLARR